MLPWIGAVLVFVWGINWLWPKKDRKAFWKSFSQTWKRRPSMYGGQYHRAAHHATKRHG